MLRKKEMITILLAGMCSLVRQRDLLQNHAEILILQRDMAISPVGYMTEFY